MRDTIDSIIQERRKTEKESRLLLDQINLLEAEKRKDDVDNLEALNRQIEELTLEKREKAEKLRYLFRIAQTISAGD